MPTLIKAKGLGTYHNELGLPEGSLLTADNVVIDRSDVINPRRGLKDYGTAAACCGSYCQLIAYKERILTHDGTKLQFDCCCTAGTFSTFSGCYLPLETGLRIKSVESNSNLYFTTTNGIQKISGTLTACPCCSAKCVTNFSTAANFIVSAGGPKALDTTGVLSFACGAFLPPLSKTAYRVVWGIKDNNKNLVFGSPSSRFLISNTDEDKYVREVSTVTAKAAACITAGDYFLLSDGSCVDYFVWYSCASCASAPATSETIGKTGIYVAHGCADTNSTIAAKTATAINAFCTVFCSTACAAVVTITNKTGGNVTDTADSAICANKTTFTFATPTQGSTCCGTSANVCLTFSIPSDVNTTCFFYQVYRSRVVTTLCVCCIPCLEPGDEMNLVIENSITCANLTAGTITVQDTTCDSFRDSGVLLYTNPTSGEGILQANEKPPISKDVEIFRETIFFGNTQTIQRKQFNFLAATCFTSGCSEIVIGNCTTAREYTFVGAKEKSTITVPCCACSVPCLDSGDYFLMNSASDEKKYFFWFGTSCETVPCTADTTGRIPIKILFTACEDGACVAENIKDQITAQTDFTATRCALVVTVCNVKNGNSADIADATPCACQTGFTFATPCQGLGEQANTGAGPAAIPAACVTAGCCSYTEPCHGFCTGVRGQWTTTCADLPSGLSINTCYFIINTSSSVFKVATSRCNALAGTAVAIADAGTGTHTFTAEGGDVLLSSLSSAAQSIDETARSLVNIINRDSCGIANAFYLSGEDDLPGIILLESRNLSDSEFFIGVCDSAIASRFNPKMPCAKSIVSTACCSCTKTIVTTSGAHNYNVNDDVYIYNTVSCTCLFGKYTITAKTCCSCCCTFNFTITQAHCATTVGKVFKADEASDNEIKPNRIYFSKTGIPEAVPLVNFLDVGRQDSAIRRIVALRDNLFIMKDDGVYILTGDNGQFTVRLLGSSTNILAPDSAAVLNNQIFMLSTQGVVTVSDTGIGVVSRSIEDKILDVASGPGFCTATQAYGMSYESDRSYLLWVPTLATDTAATQAYRYNTFNKSWVRWTIPGRAGLVNPLDDKIYISSGDNSFVRKERKNRDRTDFADREFCLTIPCQVVCPCLDQLVLSSVTCVDSGDVLVQTQFLTIAKFNRLLRKLDLDSTLGCTDYFSTQELLTGECSGQALVDLVAKICADDPCTCYTTPSSAPSTFAIIRTEHNTLVCELNSSAGVSINDYVTIGSTCCTEQEVIITEKCSNTNVVCLGFSMPILAGATVHYKGIDSIVEYAPQHFGDPSVVKQIPEGTIVFDGNNFFKGKLAYASDLSKDFACFEFTGTGPGYYGGFTNGCTAFGGEGTDVPYRNLIPRAKQRCRYITAKFRHIIAREDFSILGISFKVRPLSERGYGGM